MKTNRLKVAASMLCFLFLAFSLQAQQTGIFQTYAVLNVDNSGNQFIHGGENADLSTNNFDGRDLGSITSLILNGGEIKTFKNGGGDVFGAEVSYNVHLASGSTGSFTTINLPFESNLPNAGDQRWQQTNSGVDIVSGLPLGTYHLEVFWKSPTSLGDRFDNNGGANFTLTFSVNQPGFYNDGSAITVCPAGSFCPGDGTIGLCPAGRFSATTGASECTECSPGFFQGAQGATECIACALGEAQGQSGATACVACPAGTYADQTGLENCIACDAGTAAPPGSTECTPCAAGEYIDNGVCTVCPPGSYCPGDGTKILCPAGRFSDVSGAIECIPCAEGFFQDSQGATECLACLAGTFSNLTGSTSCTDCPAGTFQANEGAFECLACDPGFCQEDTGQTECTACSSADLVLTPSSASVNECDTITVLVSVESTDSYNTVEARLNFDPNELKVLAVNAPDGSAIGTGTFATVADLVLDNTNGLVAYAAAAGSLISGNTDFARITFEILGNTGTTSLTPITTGDPRSRVTLPGFVDGVAVAIDILENAPQIDLTLNPDSEAPVFTCPSDATVDADANCAITIPDLITGLMGTDNCGSVSFSQSPTAGTIVPASHNQVIDVTITADDGNTNQTTCIVSLTAQDVTLPSITCNSDFTLYLDDAGQASIGSNGSIELANSENDFSPTQGEKNWSYGEYPAFNTAAFSQLTYNEGNARHEGGASFGTPFITPTNAHPSFNNNDWAVRRWTSNFSGTVTLSGEFQDVDLSGGDGVHVRIYQNGTQIYEYLNVPGSVITYSQTATVANGDQIDFIVDAKNSPDNDDTRFTAVITAQGASATDNCGSPSITATNISFDCSNLGTNTVTYTATDLAGNTASCTATVTIVDDTAPTLACNADISETNDNNLCSAVVTYTNNFSDNCAIQTTVQTAGLASGSVFPVGTTTNTFVVTDASGNSSTCSFDVTVIDSQAPDVSCMDITVQLDANGMASINPEDVDNNSTDNCGIVSRTLDISTFDCGDVGANEVEFIAFDAAGIGSICFPTVTVEDNIDPVAVCQDIIVQLDAAGAATITAGQIDNGSSDACGIASLALDNTTFGCADVGANTVTLTVTDNNGNTSTCTATVTVEDNIAPTITCNADISVLNDAGICGAIVNYSNSSSDNCAGETISQTAGLASGAIFPVGTTTNTFVVTDASGNTATCSFDVTVTDDEDPTISAPADVSVNADAAMCSASGVTLGSASASDNCPGVVISDDAPATFPVGTTVVTYTATDAAGNTATATQSVTVTDDEDPTISAPANVSVSADAAMCSASSVALGSASASDNCPGVVISNDAPAIFPVGTTVVNYTATDAAGNTATATQSVTVTDDEDPITPSLADVTAECSATLTAPTTTDNCAGTITGTTSDPLTYSNQGTFTVTWNFDDGNGNSIDVDQTVTIDDVTAPVADAVSLADVTAECEVASITPPTATDNCEGSITGTTVTTFPITAQGTTVVTWSYDDGNGNISTQTQNVIINDVTDPVAPTLADVTSECSATLTAPTTTDNCAGTVTGTTSDPLIYSSQGTFTVTWNFDDGNGNSIDVDQTVIIDDMTAPVADAVSLADVTAECEVASITPPTATDNCEGSITGTTTTVFPIATQGTTTVTWTFDDGNGNLSTQTQDVVIEDMTEPILTCPANIIVSNDLGACSALVNFSATATDNCGGTPTITYSQNPGTVFPVGTTTVTVTADDGNGNTANCTFDVTVNDTENPEALCVGTLEVELNAFGTATITANDIDNGSNDACGIASLSIDRTSFDCSDISSPTAAGAALIITGVIDGPLPGGEPKAIELYVAQDISDISNYGIEIATNGNGSSGQDFALAGSVTAGSFLYISKEPSDFNTFFGFAPDIVNGSIAFNGDDAVLLYENGSVIDVFGEVNTDGTGETWEYLDGWAYRVNETGPDGSAFASGNWTYSGPNALDGETSNASASTPFPIGTYTPTATSSGIAVTLTVTDNNGNTSTCTSEVTVVESSGPQALCNIFTIQLDENGMASIDVDDVDDASNAPCGIADRSIDITDFTCADLGPNNVVLTVTDVNGATSSCTAVVTVEDVTPPTAQCTDITVQLDGTGNATITAEDIDNNSTDNCAIASRSIDIDSFTCADIGSPVTVTLTVEDGSGLTSTCTATVTVEDNVAPDAICATGLEVVLDANGNGTLTSAQVDGGSTDACGIASVSIDKENFDCNDVSLPGGTPSFALIISGVMDGPLSGGTPKVIELYAAQDIADLSSYQLGLAQNGGSSYNTTFDLSGSATAGEFIYISGNSADFNTFFGFSPDFTSSVAGSNGDDVIELLENGSVIDAIGEKGVDGTGEAWEHLDGWAYRNSDTEPSGSTFDLVAWTFSGINALDGESDNATSSTPFPIGTYGFAALSTTEVTLTVTDNSGNTSTCTSDVVVIDNIAPTAVCTSDMVTVDLDATGNATLDAATIDGGSTDNCSIATIEISPSSFTCAEVGTQTVTLTVTDQSGNSSTCTKDITVADNVDPVAVCQDITVQLDASGNATITAAQIDNGSNDACGIASLAIDNDTFDCSNVGTNVVVLTVTDNNGNVATCSATVTVEDNVAPTAVCQNITVQLNATGNASIVAADIDNGSMDACGIASLAIDVNSFDCSNVGANTVVLTVTDSNGNVSTCNATVTVEDNVAPTAVCQDITIDLDANGNASIVAADVDGGSTDACGIASIGIDIDSFDCSNIGPNTVTLTVTDNNNNTNTCTAIVTVQDVTPPTIVCPDDIVVSNDPGSCGAIVNWVQPTGMDNCSLASLSGDNLPGSFFPIGTTTVNYLVTDIAGLTGTCSFTVTVEDTEAPTLSCIGNTTVTMNQTNGTYLASGGEFDPTVSDNCPGTTVSHDAAIELGLQPGTNNESLDGWEFPIGITTITFTATDAAGLVETCSFDIEVENTVITGNVVLAGACYPIGLTVSVYPTGSETSVQTLVATLSAQIDVNGDFSVDATGVVPGNYDVYLKPDNYLARLVENVNIGATATNIAITNMIPGDIDDNEDNVINGTDVSVILGDYNTASLDGMGMPNPIFNSVADINCDGFIDALDLSLIIFFFPTEGDSPLE